MSKQNEDAAVVIGGHAIKCASCGKNALEVIFSGGGIKSSCGDCPISEFSNKGDACQRDIMQKS